MIMMDDTNTDIINQLLSMLDVTVRVPETIEPEPDKKERLSAMVAGSQSSQYLGKEYGLHELEAMHAAEINKL